MSSKDLGAQLTRAAKEAGYDGTDGVTRLHREITTHHGVRVTRQALVYWLQGARTPELASLIGLLDCLQVFGAARRAVVEIAHPPVRRIDSPNRIEDADTDPDRTEPDRTDPLNPTTPPEAA